jgi:phenylacetate-CoA ligase
VRRGAGGLHGWEITSCSSDDPDSGRPAPDGKPGELVITTLTKQALPMLRYRTRDITHLSRERCECGRTHLRIRRITGRNDDMLIVRGVNVYPSQIEAVLLGVPCLAPHYQLVLERKGSLDQVTVAIEAAQGVSPNAEAYERIAQSARHHIKSMIGITTDVVVKKPGEIPRSQGKAVRVRDLRPKV